MMFSDNEFQTIIKNTSKVINKDIDWAEDEDHSPSIEFRAEIESVVGWPLFVYGSYNRIIPALSYVLILKPVGRIYALDLGKDHHNPQCNQVGEKHKHQWSELYRDKEAYVPEDITGNVTQPVAVWKQFCDEANLIHNGILQTPLPLQGEFFI